MGHFGGLWHSERASWDLDGQSQGRRWSGPQRPRVVLSGQAWRAREVQSPQFPSPVPHEWKAWAVLLSGLDAEWGPPPSFLREASGIAAQSCLITPQTPVSHSGEARAPSAPGGKWCDRSGNLALPCPGAGQEEARGGLLCLLSFSQFLFYFTFILRSFRSFHFEPLFLTGKV